MHNKGHGYIFRQALLERGRRLSEAERNIARLNENDEKFEQGATALRMSMEEKFATKKWWKW